MKRALCLLGGALSLAAACGVDDTQPVIASSGGDAGAEPVTPIAEPAIACADSDEAIYGDPGALPEGKGAVIRCSKGSDLSMEQIQARLTGIGSTAVVTSGARTYKVLYRTERGNGAAGTSSAIVFVPTTPRASTLPLLVGGRGTRGQAASCAVTKSDILSDDEKDYARLALTLVGNGFPIIVPDLAGYANYGAAGNPPPAYAQAADVGKSTLDGSRALKRLFPQLTDTTVLVGHSQGGHSVLAALALEESYGAQGPIAGVAVYAPLWVSQRTWGALAEPSLAIRYAISNPSYTFANIVGVWYHYTQAELLDGPGEGEKLFKPEKRDAIKQYVTTSCGDHESFKALGKYSTDFYDADFSVAVGAAASGLANDCAGNAVCQKWLNRYTSDRPHLTGKAATTPIAMFYGLKDPTIPEDRMRCALDRLQEDKVNLTVCVEPEGTHGSILDLRGQHVAQWIASLTIPGASTDLPACPADATAIQKACGTPPPND